MLFSSTVTAGKTKKIGQSKEGSSDVSDLLVRHSSRCKVRNCIALLNLTIDQSVPLLFVDMMDTSLQ